MCKSQNVKMYDKTDGDTYLKRPYVCEEQPRMQDMKISTLVIFMLSNTSGSSQADGAVFYGFFSKTIVMENQGSNPIIMNILFEDTALASYVHNLIDYAT